MNKNYIWLAIAIFAISIIFIWYKKNYSFIPSAQTCGAAVTPEGTIPRGFEEEIKCMLAGHKDVYFGNIANVIHDRIPEQYAKQEIQLIILPEGNFVLYTKKGEQNAHLFAKQDEDELLRKNHYLTGHLLGYSEEDIKYFYEKNKFQAYEQDKKAAENWIKEQSK